MTKPMTARPNTGLTDRPTRVIAADARGMAEAAAVLAAGGLVGMPTETVYGLAGLAISDTSAADIYAAKGRPSFNPLIAHFAQSHAALREIRPDAAAARLAAHFWPGPLTIVAPVAADCRVSLLARAGLETLAVRVPGHETARALIEAVGAPLAAPSANRSGAVSPTSAAHVLVDLGGRIDLILDAGPCPLGIESTVVACLPDGVRLLRPGSVAREDIEAALGVRVREAGAQAAASPGAMASHYAPRAALRLDAEFAEDDEAALDFGGTLFAARGVRLDLSATGDLREAAAHLFAHLRALDASGAARICVARVPRTGLGEAINDRLRRAAAPRPQAD